MKKKIIGLIIFVVMTIALGVCYARVFVHKDIYGLYGVTNFYRCEDDSIDVLCFGSSHMFENINTRVLWDEYGMAAYDLGGAIQPLWNTYYYMKESFKTQSPELIVVDCYGCMTQEEYVEDSRIIQNTYALKFSPDKIKLIMESTPKEKWVDYMLQYPTYHRRYSEITAKDFSNHLATNNYLCFKGHDSNEGLTVYDTPEIKTSYEPYPMKPKTEEYFRKVIELAKAQNTQVLLVASPSHLPELEMRIYEAAADIAEEYDVPFVNFNCYYDEMGLDFATDFADENHLNYKGNVKYTRFLADYIKENFEVSDKRGVKGYESYDVMAKDNRMQYDDLKVRELCDNPVEMVHYLNNDEYVTVYASLGDMTRADNYDEINAAFLENGIDVCGSSKIMIIEGNQTVFNEGNGENYTWHKAYGDYDVITVTNQMGVKLNLKQKDYEAIDNGVSILCYDKYRGTLVGFFKYALDEESNMIVKR